MNEISTTNHNNPVVRVTGRSVRHESYSGVRFTRMAVAVHEDGTESACEHPQGHRTESALRKCAAALVAEINQRQSSAPKAAA